MTSVFPPQLAALATAGYAQSALPHAPVRPAPPVQQPRRLFRRKLRTSSPASVRPREADQLALDLQALVDAGLIEFRDEPGVRRYVLSSRGLELTLGLA
jgi:hypothetical protein